MVNHTKHYACICIICIYDIIIYYLDVVVSYLNLYPDVPRSAGRSREAICSVTCGEALVSLRPTKATKLFAVHCALEFRPLCAWLRSGVAIRDVVPWI